MRQPGVRRVGEAVQAEEERKGREGKGRGGGEEGRGEDTGALRAASCNDKAVGLN